MKTNQRLEQLKGKIGQEYTMRNVLESWSISINIEDISNKLLDIIMNSILGKTPYN